MAQQNRLPPLTSQVSHRKEANTKFLMVEDEQNGEPIRRKAYFHQPVAGTQPTYVHWTQPPVYQNLNTWEAEANAEAIWVKPPEGVEYCRQFPDMDMIPVIRMAQNFETEGKRALNDDYLWLKKYLGVQIELVLHPGQTGFFWRAKVQPPQRRVDYYAADVQRLKAVKDQVVTIKLYFTQEMTRQDQMDRLYEETLAHCELKHPHIVDTYSVRYRLNKGHPNAQGVINAIDNQTDLHAIILMEYSEIGSMAMFMKKLLESQLGFAYYHLYLQDIISGLVYIHSTDRAHREFNYTNCLAVQSVRSLNFNQFLWNVTDPQLTNCIIKICDFAYTKKFDQQTEQQLMRNWQSMDVMDLARNVIWHCRNYIGQGDMQKELFMIVKFLMNDDVQMRLDHLQLLMMKNEDEGKDVREFMNHVVASGGSESFA